MGHANNYIRLLETRHTQDTERIRELEDNLRRKDEKFAEVDKVMQKIIAYLENPCESNRLALEMDLDKRMKALNTTNG